MERTLKFYKVEYASGLFELRRRQTACIYSDKELLPGEFVVIEHVNYGIFIGKVSDETVDQCDNWNDKTVINNCEYKYVQHIDLSDYLKRIENAKRKEELKFQMEKRFAEIDKEKKYQYYAELDPTFKAMYEEFKNL